MISIPTSVGKRLTLTPALVSEESPLRKSYGLASDVRRLFKFFTIPQTFTDEFQYSRQLLFQFNVTLTENFYLLNVEQYRAFTRSLIVGGCLCIKYRIGTTVYRYKLLDHSTTNDWNYFTWYSNQLIRKNFCIEFWGNDLLPEEALFNRGILQTLLMQMSIMYEPSSVNEVPYTTDIDAIDVLRLADLTFGALPIDMPFTQENLVYLSND